MTSGSEKIILSVDGMSCGGCVQAVKRVMEKADPTVQADICLEDGRVEAVTKVPAGRLAEAISKAGYPAKVMLS
jgi:copper chaperone